MYYFTCWGGRFLFLVSFPVFRRIYVIRKLFPAAFAWRHPEFKVSIFNCDPKTFDQCFFFLSSLKHIVILQRRSIKKHWARELKTYNYSFCIFKCIMITTLSINTPFGVFSCSLCRAE